jgi:chromosome partitioning protein
MYEPNTKAWDLTEKAVNKYFENHRLNTKIPKNISITEAEFYRKPSVLLDSSSRGSIAYIQLANEIIKKLNKPTEIYDYIHSIN